jgi:hypothetical protein
VFFDPIEMGRWERICLPPGEGRSGTGESVVAVKLSPSPAKRGSLLSGGTDGETRT